VDSRQLTVDSEPLTVAEIRAIYLRDMAQVEGEKADAARYTKRLEGAIGRATAIVAKAMSLYGYDTSGSLAQSFLNYIRVRVEEIPLANKPQPSVPNTEAR
jgi:hypothetical protein